AWFERFTISVCSYGYTQNHSDHTIFYKHSNKGDTAILIVYVDEIILTGKDQNFKILKHILAKEFEIKDLGHLKYFLGIEITRSKNEIFVSQRKYTLDLLKEIGCLVSWL
ncbi:unnamed protein product, partial [Musa textilis]